MTIRYSGDGAQPESSDHLSLFEAIRRHWVISLLIVAVFGAIGVAFSQLAAERYVATGEIIVQDPRSDTLLNVASPDIRATMSSERNLADQVSILESAEVAEVASELLDGEFGSRYILENRTVTGSATSNLIRVSFGAAGPLLATRGADALVQAYLDVRREQIQETAGDALERVEALQAALDEDLAEIQGQLDAAAANDDARQELNAQIDQAMDDLNELRRQRDGTAPGSEARELINSQINELMSDFAGWQTVLQVERQDPQLAQLLAQQDAAITEQAELAARRNSISVDAELAAGGVTLVSPAQTPRNPTGLSSPLLVAAMGILGLAVAAAVSYFLAQRRRVIADRTMPESVLEAPLLAVVPEFNTRGSLTQLPVNAASDSAAAEAFRFAASAIASRSSAVGARTVLFTSASAGAGTTTILANTAIAAALSGQRVAVVDADYKNQRLSELLGVTSESGMTSVLEGGMSIKDALVETSGGDHPPISVLQRGATASGSSSVLNQDSAEKIFLYLADEFDLVLIDAPALLRVAYASTLARAADSAVLIVDHESPVDALEEAGDRLRLLATFLLGYIYTKAPVKAEHMYRGTEPARAPREPRVKDAELEDAEPNESLKRIGDIELAQQIRSPDQGHSHW